MTEEGFFSGVAAFFVMFENADGTTWKATWPYDMLHLREMVKNCSYINDVFLRFG